jgi:hypothetical protein
MEELFRFAVLRPVEKSLPKVTALATKPKQEAGTPATPGQAFEQMLHTALARPADGESNEQIWSWLEQPAATFLATATSTVTGDPLWAELAAFITDLTALGADAVDDIDEVPEADRSMQFNEWAETLQTWDARTEAATGASIMKRRIDFSSTGAFDFLNEGVARRLSTYVKTHGCQGPDGPNFDIPASSASRRRSRAVTPPAGTADAAGAAAMGTYAYAKPTSWA